jgi:hypothetical protein
MWMLTSNVFIKKISDDKVLIMSLEREEILTVTGKLAALILALQQGRAVSELSALTGVPPSTVDKILDTLASLDFLEDPFRVTPKGFIPEGFSDADSGELQIENLDFSEAVATKNEETW